MRSTVGAYAWPITAARPNLGFGITGGGEGRGWRVGGLEGLNLTLRRASTPSADTSEHCAMGVHWWSSMGRTGRYPGAMKEESQDRGKKEFR